MKNHLYFLLFLSVSVSSQESIEAEFIKKAELNAETFIGIDNFEALYYLNDNVLYKKNNDATINYNNVQLGEITGVNIFGPLKINVFYKDFNTVIILDNRLSEIFKIDFNKLQPYRNITHVSTGNENTLWVFNQDTQQLEVYDYKSRKTRTNTLPIQNRILDLKSDFNVCWALTKDYLYNYNYTGSLNSKIKNEGYTSFFFDNGNIILKKENNLFYLKKDSKTIQAIKLPELLIKQFFVTNETLYIYGEEFLHEYQLITN